MKTDNPKLNNVNATKGSSNIYPKVNAQTNQRKRRAQKRK